MACGEVVGGVVKTERKVQKIRGAGSFYSCVDPSNVLVIL